MRKLKIGERTILDDDVFVVAEIGSNHMGDLGECERLIKKAASCGVDAAKLQMRDNDEMFTKTLLNSKYDNELSYGKTYGEHRNYLDWFGAGEFALLQNIAHDCGIILFATPFEQKSADLLNHLDMPIFKIASCDSTNLPLVRHIAGFGKPLIISTGGATDNEIMDLHAAVWSINQNFALLHCVSLYPNTDNVLNLRTLTLLKHLFPKTLIGFSSHHPGLLPLYIARTLGASIFEVHFTMSRGNRGTDHGFSLEPEGLRKLCDDLPRIRPMIGHYEKVVNPAEKEGFIRKFGKGIYLKRPLKAGNVIKAKDICFKAPAGGLKPQDSYEIIGKALINDVSTGISLERGDFGEKIKS